MRKKGKGVPQILKEAWELDLGNRDAVGAFYVRWAAGVPNIEQAQKKILRLRWRITDLADDLNLQARDMAYIISKFRMEFGAAHRMASKQKYIGHVVYKPNYTEHGRVSMFEFYAYKELWLIMEEEGYLGICEVCDGLYRPGKMGRKQKYCCDACKSVAYRRRRRENGETTQADNGGEA